MCVSLVQTQEASRFYTFLRCSEGQVKVDICWDKIHIAQRIYGNLMVIYGELMLIYGELMDFNVNLMDINGDLW